MKLKAISILLLGFFILSGCDRLLSEKATEEQNRYYRNQISNTEKIELRQHSKLGGKTLATITDPKDMFQISIESEPNRTHAPTGSFGMFDILFYLSDGEVFRVNYSLEHNRMSYENPWGVEVIPYKNLPGLIRKHLTVNQSGDGQ